MNDNSYVQKTLAVSIPKDGWYRIGKELKWLRAGTQLRTNENIFYYPPDSKTLKRMLKEKEERKKKIQTIGY